MESDVERASIKWPQRSVGVRSIADSRAYLANEVVSATAGQYRREKQYIHG